MAEWKQKRFWTEAAPVAEADGFAVALDGRKIKTPAKSSLILPTEALAQMVAEEWAAQGEEVDPGSMPVTRMANSAIDKVRVKHAEIATMIAEYGGTDLLCYRADGPDALIARQVAAWDPALDWAREKMGVSLQIGSGVMFFQQPEGDLKVLSDRIHALDDFQLAAAHDLVGLSGSLILGLAAMDGWRSPEEIWDASRVDDIWQQEQWGADDEAVDIAETKRASFLQAHRFYANC
ncbi:MAG: ATP12 family chaperone protein [Paracoccaceae bacterium]